MIGQSTDFTCLSEMMEEWEIVSHCNFRIIKKKPDTVQLLLLRFSLLFDRLAMELRAGG
jgi:hypothetical protein